MSGTIRSVFISCLLAFSACEERVLERTLTPQEAEAREAIDEMFKLKVEREQSPRGRFDAFLGDLARQLLEKEKHPEKFVQPSKIALEDPEKERQAAADHRFAQREKERILGVYREAMKSDPDIALWAQRVAKRLGFDPNTARDHVEVVWDMAKQYLEEHRDISHSTEYGR